MKTKLLTLAIVLQKDRVLLGMKKRGFGAGRWNGFGGKVHDGETIEEAARRETKEECGLTVTKMEKYGVHEFEFEHDRSTVLEVHVFRVVDWDGEPVETEEMKPAWYSVDAIPYDEMWPDDRYWLPLLLEGQKFHTKFLFGEGDQILEQDIQIIPPESSQEMRLPQPQ